MHGLETDMVDPAQTDLHGLAIPQPPGWFVRFQSDPFFLTYALLGDTNL